MPSAPSPWQPPTHPESPRIAAITHFSLPTAGFVPCWACCHKSFQEGIHKTEGKLVAADPPAKKFYLLGFSENSLIPKKLKSKDPTTIAVKSTPPPSMDGPWPWTTLKQWLHHNAGWYLQANQRNQGLPKPISSTHRMNPPNLLLRSVAFVFETSRNQH